MVMTSLILFNVLILSMIAVIAAIVLYFTAKKFQVENNPLVDEIAAVGIETLIYQEVDLRQCSNIHVYRYFFGLFHVSSYYALFGAHLSYHESFFIVNRMEKAGRK